MSIVVENLMKLYGPHAVVHNLSLEVADGEFFVLLGPSGSGKSTVLRLIAGLTPADGGRVLLHGRDVTHLPPQRRGVGFVFQSYALFRHMTVAENVEFALRIRRVGGAARRRRRDELLDLVGLAGLGERLPRQLSGGQQQRVALARALAHEPEVLLLDEPFGALDARIRTELRRTVRGIQRRLGITTIFVTHDQEEAFELADRIGVQNFGRLLEVGPPEELYQRPQTEFVATFLGTANLLVGEAAPEGVRLGPVRFPLATHAAEIGARRRVQVLIRPEDLALRLDPESLPSASIGRGRVIERAFVGAVERLRVGVPPLPGVRVIAPATPFGAPEIVLEAARAPHEARRRPLREGDEVHLGVGRLHALAHPGMSFLLLTDGSDASAAALDLGARIARLAHARVTLLGWGAPSGDLAGHLQHVKDQIGSGLASIDARVAEGSLREVVEEETGRRPCDLVIAGFAPKARVEAARQVLRAGDHHLLHVPARCATPAKVLVCVSVGEPGKEDVLFAGRLVRHLGAEGMVLTVMREEGVDEERAAEAGRFLEAAARTLTRLGVPARTSLRRGEIHAGIRAEAAAGFDLIVVGAPAGDPGRDLSRTGISGRLLTEMVDRPLLVVRSGGPEGPR